MRIFRFLGRLAIVSAAGFLLNACVEDALKEAVVIDAESLRPPLILGVWSVSSRVVEARFSKAAWLDPASASVHPDTAITAVEDGGPVVRLTLAEDGVPGRKYTLDAVVTDERGNTCSFLYEFYGFNGRVPGLVINEIITAPSTTVYTGAEIAVLSGGNMGGVTFFEGTKSYPDKKFVFPSFEVETGAFILLHFNAAGAPGEIDETENMTSASGKGASPTAYDFWAPGTGNLSADNDALSLYSDPEGRLLDGFLYTTRVYADGMKYNGFGTAAMLGKAVELARDGGWKTAGAEPYPGDAFNPKGATSERSICRDSSSGDSGGKEDWHIVPAGERTPGGPNSDAVYVP